MKAMLSVPVSLGVILVGSGLTVFSQSSERVPSVNGRRIVERLMALAQFGKNPEVAGRARLRGTGRCRP
jgi:hypothetical protein